MSGSEKVLNACLKAGGSITIPPFNNRFPIEVIRGVAKDDTWIDVGDDWGEQWDDYIEDLMTRIGVQHFFEIVRNDDGDVIGLLACSTLEGIEIKLKYFCESDWKQLARQLEAKQ